jgi:hypothetical protein
VLLGYTLDQDGIYTLSELLSDKYVRNKEVRFEKLGDAECILLEATGFQASETKPIYDVRVWIDPKRNYRPLKIEEYESPDDKNLLAGLRGERWKHLTKTVDNIELKQVDGIWFPVCGEQTLYTTKLESLLEGKSEEEIRKQYPGMSDEELAKKINLVFVPFGPTHRVEAREIKINKGIDPAKFTIVFPAGCKVWDDIVGMGYVVGDPENIVSNELKNTNKTEVVAQPNQEHLPQQPNVYMGLEMKNPKIACVNGPDFDWGVIDEDVSIEHDFIVKNEGNADLVIESIKTGCGCTKAEITKNTLAPDETATLKVKYTARNVPYIESIAVWIKSNDMNTPVKQFTITGLVKLALSCRPKSLSFDLSTEKEPIGQKLYFKPNVGTFEFVKCSSPDSIVLEWIQKDGGYECEVKLKPGFSDGVNQKIIAEFKVDGEVKDITVPVYILY